MAKAIRRASKRDGAAVLRELNKAIIRDAITNAELSLRMIRRRPPLWSG
jgi:hypothetical protein